MVLGVDVVRGGVEDQRADTVAGSLAKAVKDKVDGYANDHEDVVALQTHVFGGYVYVMILHK